MLTFTQEDGSNNNNNNGNTGEGDRIGGPILPTAVELEYWVSGINAFDGADYEMAAAHFRRLGDRAKPLYNVAVCYLNMKDHDSAV